MARVFRLLLACIVMFAVPLQGFASTTMLLCASSPGHHASDDKVAGGGPDNAGPHSFAGHDHSKHDHGTQGGSPQVKSGDLSQAEAKANVDATHKCGACASCCHLVAISEPPAFFLPSPLPKSDLTELSVHVSSLPAIGPDTPPRV